MAINFITPHEQALRMAKQVQEKRLSLNLTQQTLAQRAGVTYAVLKKFERTGQISLESLLKIALILGCLEKFDDLFPVMEWQKLTSLDQLINMKKRKRGRE